MNLGRFSLVFVPLRCISVDVMKKTVPRWNQGIKGVNPLFDERVCLNNMYMTRN